MLLLVTAVGTNGNQHVEDVKDDQDGDDDEEGEDEDHSAQVIIFSGEKSAILNITNQNQDDDEHDNDEQDDDRWSTSGIIYSGEQSAMLDIANNFAGTLMGIINALGNSFYNFL